MSNPFDGKRIFLMDDNPNGLSVITSLLRIIGAVVFPVTYNFKTIMSMEESLPIDLILLDLKPGRNINGYDIYDAIRNRPIFSDIPIVCMGYCDPEVEIPRAKAKGFTGFIHKPINRALLFDWMLDCMEGRQVWDTGLKRPPSLKSDFQLHEYTIGS